MEEKEIIAYGIVFVIIVVVIVFAAKLYFYSSSSTVSSNTNSITTNAINLHQMFANNTFNLSKSSNNILFGNTTYKDLFNKTYYFNNERAIISYINSLPIITVTSSIFLSSPANLELAGTSKNITINLEGHFAVITGGTNPGATVTIMNGIYAAFDINHIINDNAYNVNLP
ncbi:MAG: hypothetical protein QW478_09555 [Candidatus Micrarchaeaceae archaeon]